MIFVPPTGCPSLHPSCKTGVVHLSFAQVKLIQKKDVKSSALCEHPIKVQPWPKALSMVNFWGTYEKTWIITQKMGCVLVNLIYVHAVR